jgi:hypothetical protein
MATASRPRWNQESLQQVPAKAGLTYCSGFYIDQICQSCILNLLPVHHQRDNNPLPRAAMLYRLVGHLKRLYIYDLVSLDCKFLRFIYLFRHLLLHQYPQYTQLLNLFGEGILCIFDTGNAWPWCVVHPLNWKETSLFFQSSKVPQKVTHIK